MSVISKKVAGIQYPNSIVDEEWEYLDPTPDIHALFMQFNERFFDNKLMTVVVEWSPRMTVCAGICKYQTVSGHCSIGLSIPLLKLRPRSDLVQTLLHEMIHAYLFLTKNNRDRDGHGPEFQYHMNRINQESGTKITIYHSFHDEVKLYKQHWWKCNGPCQTRPPFYGLVKRSMNRAPGPNDMWWAAHKSSCNGSYIKIKEPEDYGVKKKKETQKDGPGSKKQKVEVPAGARDIRGFFTSPPSNKPIASGSQSNFVKSAATGNSKFPAGKSGFAGMVKNKGSSTVTIRSPTVDVDNPSAGPSSNDARPTQGGVVSRPPSNFIPFAGPGRVLGGGATKVKTENPLATKSKSVSVIATINLDDSLPIDHTPGEELVPCPSCQVLLCISQINAHLDSCLS